MQLEPLVHSPDGTLRGRALTNGGFCFAGVPFAAPPIGPLRFRPLQPVEPWTGVREAVHSPRLPCNAPCRSQDCQHSRQAKIVSTSMSGPQRSPGGVQSWCGSMGVASRLGRDHPR